MDLDEKSSISVANHHFNGAISVCMKRALQKADDRVWLNIKLRDDVIFTFLQKPFAVNKVTEKIWKSIE